MYHTWLQLTAIATNNFLLTVPQGSEDGIRIEGLLFGNLGWQLVPGSSPPMVSAFVTPNSGTSTIIGDSIKKHNQEYEYVLMWVRVQELIRVRVRFGYE